MTYSVLAVTGPLRLNFTQYLEIGLAIIIAWRLLAPQDHGAHLRGNCERHGPAVASGKTK